MTANELSRLTQIAIKADEAWQRELDANKVDRYMLKARLDPRFSELYQAKLAADEVMRQAFDAFRQVA